jgi:hypothetical protein
MLGDKNSGSPRAVSNVLVTRMVAPISEAKKTNFLHLLVNASGIADQARGGIFRFR